MRLALKEMRKTMEKLEVKNWGTSQIDLSGICFLKKLGYPTVESRLDQVHMKEDGAVGDKPSFLFLSTIPMRQFVVFQASEETLIDVFDRLGYRLEKK